MSAEALAKLVTVCLGFHIPILVAAIGVFYKFSEYYRDISTVVSNTAETVRLVRNHMLSEFLVKLRELANELKGITIPIIRLAENDYREEKVDLFESEGFVEAVTSIVRKAHSTIDFEKAIKAKAKCRVQIKIRGWCSAFFLLWQLLIVGYIGIGLKVAGITTIPWILKASFAPTFLIILFIISCCMLIMKFSNTVDKIREKYEDT